MAEDAGPLLARAGLIQDEQLLEARRAQASHGGTLGEHLVLAGFIDDEELTSFFRSRLMVPRVDPRQLEQIPPRVIQRIPKDMAAEFRLVPVAVDREQNLVLAMSDPSNTHAVDEIGFFTGAYVVRAVANQREIAAALERYYGIETPLLVKNAPPPAEQPAAEPTTPSARHKVMPPMATTPESSGRAVRISEIVPAVRAAKEAEALAMSSGRVSEQHAPATATPDARTLVPGEHLAPDPVAPHERRTQPDETPLRFDPEQDTRPIARAMDLVPKVRVSTEAPIVTAGEISAPHKDARTAEPLDAVIVADLATPPSEPAVLLTRKRPSEPPPAEAEPQPQPSSPNADDVVLLSKRKTQRSRRPSPTRQGIGALGADSEPPTAQPAPAAQPPAAQQPPTAQPRVADPFAATEQLRALPDEPQPATPAEDDEPDDPPTARLPALDVEVPLEHSGPIARAAEVERTNRMDRRQQVREADDDWGEPGSTIPPQYIGATYDYVDPGSPIGVPVPDVIEPQSREVDTAADYDASVRRLAAALETLDTAPTRDDVIAALVGYMAASCRRAAFFALTRGTLRTWSAQGAGVTTSDEAQLSLDKPSTFQDVVATRLPFHGPVHDARTRDFLMAAVGATPTDMTALPVCVRDKVIGIVFGDDRKHQLFDDHLTSLVRSAGAALERIVMKRKGTRHGH